MEFPIGKKLFHLVVTRKPRYVAVPDRGPGTGTNYEKRKWNTTFRSEIPTGKTGPPFLDFPLFLGIFQWDEPTQRFPFTAEPEISEILTKWKAPTKTHETDRNPPITNHRPWPFEPVDVKFCFPRGLLRWLTAAKKCNRQLAFELQNFTCLWKAQ